MRKTIVRTIVATTINSANVSISRDGILQATENDPIVMNGIINEEKALKEVRKAYGDSAQVTSIKSVNDVYEISVEDFIKYAKKVEAPTPDQQEEASAE
jgi:hypothetical protein